MKRYLLLILAAMLFSISGAMAQIDTVWVSNRYCSTENIAVSPDERFVVTWGDHGWSDPSDPLPPDSLFDGWGNPAKVFNAQTGEWLKTIWDSTSEQPNHVAYVSFSPDSSKMLVGFNIQGNLIVDLNNNFNVIDTVPHQGIATYSPDMSLIVADNNSFYDANTLEKVAYFTYTDKIKHYETGYPLIHTQEKVGIFRKNGREYVFTYRWSTQTMPFGSGGTGMAVIDLVDSTITLTPDVPYAQWYYRNGSNKYAMVEKGSLANSYLYSVKDFVTDQLIFAKDRISISEKPYLFFICNNDNYFVSDTIFDISTGEAIECVEPLTYNSLDYDRQKLYTSTWEVSGGNANNVIAYRNCWSTTGIPPTIQESIQSYPVPTNNILNMNIELKAGNYTAEVVDIQGKTIRTHNLGFKQEGYEKLEFDTSDLPSGTYMMIIRSESDAKTVKFIKH